GARCCPRTRPPAAARLAPSAAARSDVLRPERYSRPPDILAQGDGSGCSQRYRPAWLSYSFTSARSIDAPSQRVRGAGPGTLPRHQASGMPAGKRGVPPDTAREAVTAYKRSGSNVGGGRKRRCARTGDRAQAPHALAGLVTMNWRSASGRPRAANDALRRSAPPLATVGPRRLQATGAEGARLGCSVVLGD